MRCVVHDAKEIITLARGICALVGRVPMEKKFVIVNDAKTTLKLVASLTLKGQCHDILVLF